MELNPTARCTTDDTLAKAAKQDSAAFRELREVIILALTQGGHENVSLEHFLSFDWSKLEDIAKSAAKSEEIFRSSKSIPEILSGDPTLATRAFDYWTRQEEIRLGGMSEELAIRFLSDQCVNPWQKQEAKPEWHNLSEPDKRFWTDAFFKAFTGSPLSSRISRDQWCAAPWATLKASILGTKMSFDNFLRTLDGTYEVSGYGMISQPPVAHLFQPEFLISISDGAIKFAFVELRGYTDPADPSKDLNPVAKCSKIEMTSSGFRLHFLRTDFNILSSGGKAAPILVRGDVVAEADMQAAMSDIDYSSKGKFFFPQWTVSLFDGEKKQFQLTIDKQKAKFVPKNGYAIFQFVAPQSGWSADKKSFVWTRWDPLDSKWYTAERIDATMLPLHRNYAH
jgi:hypothetical protein